MKEDVEVQTLVEQRAEESHERWKA